MNAYLNIRLRPSETSGRQETTVLTAGLLRRKVLMATAALTGKQRAGSMGLPCEKDTEDQPRPVNHENVGMTEDSGGEAHDTPNTGQTPGVDQESSFNSKETQKKPGRPKAKTRVKTPAKRRKKEIVPQTPPQHENSTNADTSELTSSGRPKRRAAKVALDYLHTLAKDFDRPSEVSTKDTPKSKNSVQKKKPAKGKGRGAKRKAPDSDSDDEDFAPDNDQDEEESEDEVDSEPEFDLVKECKRRSSRGHFHGMLANGLAANAMGPVWNSFRKNKDFRDENLSPWVFPEWIPSAKDWHILSNSEAEKYLPQEKKSAAFTFTRETFKGKTDLQRVKRFESLPHHGDRWDSLFFVGGPVRSMEWCPCPDGAAPRQYAAIYCHKGMDDRNEINKMHTGPVLLQLWDIGELQCKSRPSTVPHLAYALAVDDGCIWNIKWCPAGAWELPSTNRKAPQLARLGLLAAAFANGTIGVYSLPHPQALAAHHQSKGEDSKAPLICQGKRVLTLKMGSNQADHKSQSGLCFAMDWLHVKPHNLLAAGFSDGVVALWDLCSKSSLLKVRSPDGGLVLYPYHCFFAHNEIVRTLCWCRASTTMLVTVGDDRMAKVWDLKKTHTPLLSVKRCLTTEVYWPLFWSGILMAQESCYATFGQHGVHYFDSGYVGIKPFFVCPRKATVWSISMTDWLNSFVIGDNGGDCVLSLLPEMNADPTSIRRRRFSVYRTDLVPFEPGQRDEEVVEEEEEVEKPSFPGQEPQSYKGATRKYYLHFHDLDLGNFAKSESRPMMQHLQKQENKGIVKVDQMPLNALYKVCFNPNMDAYNWVLSAGQSGLVRVHCVRGLSNSVMVKLLHETQAQFSAMFQSQESEDSATAVRHTTADTVQVC
ncbi:general transcription factor 3C polypeptide 2 [Triplophysa rosa]|uniref:General transcription factor 3C polypeptide 2 TF3C-beta n=1 Tax=Triplophysa rosa TaxID=992332 RepID=A0A9W7TPA2_TRIRA|nr:general transcription factor 3C polypeptide 2 [Triplophysa rosa]KAI7799988.1 hypothetical protein IRJ41_020134 [Triplophysa rosa]